MKKKKLFIGWLIWRERWSVSRCFLWPFVSHCLPGHSLEGLCNLFIKQCICLSPKNASAWVGPKKCIRLQRAGFQREIFFSSILKRFRHIGREIYSPNNFKCIVSSKGFCEEKNKISAFLKVLRIEMILSGASLDWLAALLLEDDVSPLNGIFFIFLFFKSRNSASFCLKILSQGKVFYLRKLRRFLEDCLSTLVRNESSSV